MSSELTIDIQLTELGFSSWDFQDLKQRETHQTSDLEYASSSSSSSSTPPASSSCPMTVEILADEELDVAHLTPVVSSQSAQPIPKDNPSLLHVDSTETSTGESSRTDCEKESGSVGEKRRKCPWYDENADEQFKEDKKKKMHGDHRKNDKEVRERGAESKLVSVADVSGEEEDEEEEEDDEDDSSHDDDDGSLTDEEEGDDVLSSGMWVCEKTVFV